jgi:hypothetical protein
MGIKYLRMLYFGSLWLLKVYFVKCRHFHYEHQDVLVGSLKSGLVLCSVCLCFRLWVLLTWHTSITVDLISVFTDWFLVLANRECYYFNLSYAYSVLWISGRKIFPYNPGDGFLVFYFSYMDFVWANSLISWRFRCAIPWPTTNCWRFVQCDRFITIGQASGINVQWRDVRPELLLCMNVHEIFMWFESLASEYVFIDDILDFFKQFVSLVLVYLRVLFIAGPVIAAYSGKLIEF